MSSKIETKPDTKAAPKGRGGRPPASMVGDVDARLLDAAKQLFLARGYEATSCDQVASLAGAGKASLYARYANKEALFTAVVTRNIDSTLEWSGEVPRGPALAERLQAVGVGILEHCLRPDVVAMMRMIIETAPRFPALAENTHRLGRAAGVARVMHAILGDDIGDEDRIARARQCAERFMDYTFAPHQMSALLGTSHEELKATAGAQVRRVIEMFDASGLLEGLA